jgi:predicted aldo/keto reductase-like oxidoreductase
MAAKKNNKSIEDIKNKIETTLNKIDVDKVDFGEIKMMNDTNEFVLTEENQLDELIDYLNNFTNKLSAKKEQTKTERINDKLINELKNGGENANLIAEIFNK